MAENKMIRLGQASRKLNVGHNTILDYLSEKGFEVENNPNAKLTGEQFAMLSKEFATSASEKREASGLTIGVKHTEDVTIETENEASRKKTDEDEQILIKNLGSSDIKPKDEPKQPEKVEHEKTKLEGIKVLGKIDLEKKKIKEEPKKEEPVAEEKEKQEVKEDVKEEKKEVVPEKEEKKEQELIKAKANRLQGLKVVDRIELPAEKKKEQPVASSDKRDEARKRRPRKRIIPPRDDRSSGGGSKGKKPFAPRTPKAEPTEKEIQEQVRATLAKLSGNQKKTGGAKYRKEKRQAVSDAEDERLQQEQEDSKTLKVTEFISANDLASFINGHVHQ
ncbi:MAG: translation initiation factor IF-2, partial [Cyclobacteriaceae bacterium]